MTKKGYKLTEAHKKAIGDAQRGENNNNWQTDIKDMSIGTIHKRVRMIKLKPVNGKCEYCHKVKSKYGITKLHLVNIRDHYYSLNPGEYQYMHPDCHVEHQNISREKRKSQLDYWLRQQTINLKSK